MARILGIKNLETLEERFWSKIRTNTNSGCWETFATSIAPSFHVDRGIKKNMRQVAWFIVHGGFPDGVLENSCGNLKCVNPEHHILCKSWRDRFWMYVDKKAEDNECWNWKAHKDIKGYGIFRHDYGTKAHRASWILHNGLIPDGLLVCHKCDNPSCVNPNHLFLGTVKDNNLDKELKGRQKGARGERNFGAVLNEKQVDAIRFLYSSGKFSTYKLVDIFQVSRNCIAKIVNNKTWRYVDED